MNKTTKYKILFVGSISLIVVAIVLFIISLTSSKSVNNTKDNMYVEESREETEDCTEESTDESTEESTECPSDIETTGEETLDLTLISHMYAVTNVNVRTEPNTMSEIYTTLYATKEISVYDYSEEDEWSKILIDNKIYYISSEFITKDKPKSNSDVAPVKTNLEFGDDFHYYGIWTGAYWHFTPEQIDNQWGGYKKSKPKLEEGTTRAWQEYLYQELNGRGLSWWYKYACAQAMQESGFNPLNNASIDHGLFSFREKFWNSSYGDILDYHANINAYIDRIAPHLVAVTNDEDIYRALSQHYNPDGQLHMNYVNAVLSRLNELWICD